jgi:hypothetical protein
MRFACPFWRGPEPSPTLAVWASHWRGGLPHDRSDYGLGCHLHHLAITASITNGKTFLEKEAVVEHMIKLISLTRRDTT